MCPNNTYHHCEISPHVAFLYIFRAMMDGYKLWFRFIKSGERLFCSLEHWGEYSKFDLFF